MNDFIRGLEREKGLSLKDYFSNDYFLVPQLCSYVHQLHIIKKMNPDSLIEVGIGNGFVSGFLKLSGIRVITADVNSNLNPDICAPLSELPNYVEEDFDLVVCCEVLEHMPLEDLDNNLECLRRLGSRLFLTLPNSYRRFGVSGLIFLPRIGSRFFDMNFDIPFKRSLDHSSHFWEVGYSNECTQKNIINRLNKHFSSVRSGRFALNPGHIWFLCE